MSTAQPGTYIGRDYQPRVNLYNAPVNATNGVDPLELRRLRDEAAYQYVNPFPPHIGRKRTIFNVLAVLALLGILIWYITIIVNDYQDAQDNPIVSLTRENPKDMVLEFPAITVCNFSTVDTGITLSFCDVATGTGETIDDCTASVQEFFFTNADGSVELVCFTANADPNINGFTAMNDGVFANFIELQFILEFNDAVEHVLGASVVFHERNVSVDYEMINHAPAYAQPGSVSVFSITKTQFIDKNRTMETSWRYTDSYTALVNSETVAFNVFVYYNTLQTEVSREQASYRLSGLFGDLAGMIGILLGLDILKVLLVGEALPGYLRVVPHRFSRRIQDPKAAQIAATNPNPPAAGPAMV